MKSRIFMYLFIFSLLLILFQYVNSKKILDEYENRITTLETFEEKYQDSLKAYGDTLYELSLFDFEHNEKAMTYYEDQGYRISELVPFIKDELYKLNVYEGEDHPLVPYVSMTDNKMMINSVQLINHRWLLADFTDGKYWGEMIIGYELLEDGKVDFELKEYVLYH